MNKRDQLKRQAVEHIREATGRWPATAPMTMADASEEELREQGWTSEQIAELKAAARRVSMAELERRAKE